MGAIAESDSGEQVCFSVADVIFGVFALIYFTLGHSTAPRNGNCIKFSNRALRRRPPSCGAPADAPSCCFASNGIRRVEWHESSEGSRERESCSACTCGDFRAAKFYFQWCSSAAANQWDRTFSLFGLKNVESAWMLMKCVLFGHYLSLSQIGSFECESDQMQYL